MRTRAPHETHRQNSDTTSEPPETSRAPATRFDWRALRRHARRRGWKLPITDGPFAESKEMIGG